MRRSLVLLLFALVIGGLCLALNALQPEEAAAPITTPQTQSYRMLYTRDQADFASMTVTLASGESYTVDSSLAYDEQGNYIGVYNSLGQPVTVRGQEGFALDSTSFQMILLTATNLPVTASYPGLDEGACGLDSPAARLEIGYHSGETITLAIGKAAASGYSCYVKMAGDENIHLVPLDFRQVMTRSLNEHHRLVGALNAAPSQAVQIAVVQPDGTAFIATNYTDEGRILTWQVEKPYLHAGSKAHIEVFVEEVCAIGAVGYEASASTMEELAPYGLDAPLRLLVALGNGTIRDIHLGHDAGNGQVYARMDTTGDVYRVRSADLPALVQTGTDELLDRFVALVASKDMRTTTVTLPSASYILAQPRDEAGEITGQIINDAPVPLNLFGDCYEAIVGVQFDKVTTDQPAGEALAQVRFDLLDGSALTVSYHDHDVNYVQAVTSTGGSFLLRRERFDNMLTTLKEALP